MIQIILAELVLHSTGCGLACLSMAGQKAVRGEAELLYYRDTPYVWPVTTEILLELTFGTK